MSIAIEQRDINTVKGFVNLALNDLKFSQYRNVPENKRREAYFRAVRTLNELLEKIEQFEKTLEVA